MFVFYNIKIFIMKHFYFFITFILTFPVVIYSQDRDPFGNLDKSKIKTGLLYDKVKLPVSKIKSFTANNKEFINSPSEWREILGEIRQASFKKTTPDVLKLKQSVKSKLRKNIFTIGIINFRYNSFKKEALENGSVKVVNNKIVVTNDNVYDYNTVFTVSPVDTKQYTGKSIVFDFASDYYFSNYDKKPDYIIVDFNEGKGFQKIKPDDKVKISYKYDGVKYINIKLVLKSGETFSSGFKIKIATPKMPAPSEIWTGYTADIPYLGSAAQGEVGVFFGNGNSDFTRPVIIVDGFDPGDTRDIAGLWDIANQQNMVDNLRAEGYDFVIANFYGGDDYIQRNAMLVVKLIQDINTRMTAAGTMKPANQIVVIGPSMGGLITRYAIRYMEQNSISHNVRNWISFDSPMKGADIPLGLQHWVRFFAEEAGVTGAQEAQVALSGPAAKQMLIYHYTATSGNTANSNGLFTSFYNEINAMGFPEQTRIVAIANGSGYAQDQGFGPGDQVVDYTYRSLLVDIDGNIWAVPNQSYQRIFQGGLNKIWPLPDTYENIYVNNTLPYDGAAGGKRSTFLELDQTDTGGYGDIVALHNDHSFIPTISSMCVQNTVDPYYNINDNINTLTTPFDKLYYPVENQEHVAITPESYNWFYHEVINFAPQFTSVPIASVNEDSQYSYTLTASDENEWNTLIYELIEKPAWLNFDANTGIFSGIPANEDVGIHNVSVKVTDGLDESIQTFTVTVNNVNDAPVFTSIPAETATEDSEYTYIITATDEDPTNDTLTLSAVDIPAWLNFDAGTGTLSGTPLNEDVGTYNVKLRVNDGTVDVDQNFTITVQNTNDAPSLNEDLEDQNILAGTDFSYTFAKACFTDIDAGDTLYYSAYLSDGSGLPDWLNFNPENRTFSGTPYDVQILNVKVTATDDSSATVSGNFTITVNENNVAESSPDEDFKIYPNPARDFIYFDLPYSKTPYVFDLYDINGKKIISQNISSNEEDEINISKLSRGYYIIKLKISERLIYKKFTVQ